VLVLGEEREPHLQEEHHVVGHRRFSKKPEGAEYVCIRVVHYHEQFHGIDTVLCTLAMLLTNDVATD
jgi:hypothetical protein